MESGTVSWYSQEKGYGFVTPDGGGPDVAVYAETLESAKLGALELGDKVRFTAEPHRLARKVVSIERTAT